MAGASRERPGARAPAAEGEAPAARREARSAPAGRTRAAAGDGRGGAAGAAGTTGSAGAGGGGREDGGPRGAAGTGRAAPVARARRRSGGKRRRRDDDGRTRRRRRCGGGHDRESGGRGGGQCRERRGGAGTTGSGGSAAVEWQRRVAARPQRRRSPGRSSTSLIADTGRRRRRLRGVVRALQPERHHQLRPYGCQIRDLANARTRSRRASRSRARVPHARDLATGGGFVPDYTYSKSFDNNAGDEVNIYRGGTLIDRSPTGLAGHRQRSRVQRRPRALRCGGQRQPVELPGRRDGLQQSTFAPTHPRLRNAGRHEPELPLETKDSEAWPCTPNVRAPSDEPANTLAVRPVSARSGPRSPRRGAAGRRRRARPRFHCRRRR